MSKWPDKHKHPQHRGSHVPIIDQPSLNYSPSEADTSYAGSMSAAKWSQIDDESKSRVSTYSYRSDRDASRFVRQVEGRARFLQVVNIFTRLWCLIALKCSN
jgi:hypothetical protein